jgi:hypothetical protein
MTDYGYAEWIVSRKIVVKSLARHFAPWKSRYFVLDRAGAVLGIQSSSESTMVLIPLSTSTISLQRHEYGGDDKYLLTLKYTEEQQTTLKEIVMKFDSLEHLEHWEKVIAVDIPLA